MNRLLRAETAFFLVIWLILFLAFRERGFYDPGALWHVKVGEIILSEGMPHTDPFSFTFAGTPWVPQQWGAEVLMAVAHAVGGFDTMLLAFTTGAAFLFTLIFRRCVQNGMGPLLAVLIVGGCLFVGAFHYYIRPHMFTIALLAWTMMCIVDYERGRCSEWRLVGLVPLYVLWTNLHGGVLGGTMTLGLAVAGWGVVFLLSRSLSGGRFSASPPVGGRRSEAAPPTSAASGVGLETQGAHAPRSDREQGAHAPRSPGTTPITSWRTAFLLGAIVVACLLTPFVNPHGMEMIRIWQRIVGSELLPKIIVEHMPLDPASPLGMSVIGLGAFYVAMLLGTLPKFPRVSWLLPLVWFVLSFKGIRQGPLFAVVAAVAIADLWPHTIWHRLLVKYGDGSLARDPGTLPTRGTFGWAVIPIALVALALGLQVGKVPVPVIGHGWVRFDPSFVPIDLNREVAEYAASVSPGTPIFNDANLGGYLIYYAPRLKVFMDDRCELYGDEWMKMYTDTLRLPPDQLGVVFEQWQRDYHFERAIIMTDPDAKERPRFEQYLLSQPTRWKEVARGHRAAMFERVR